MALSYTQENLTPTPIYWHFENNATTITVNIRATTTAGNTVSESRTFHKSDAETNYEEVGDAFTGGDALEINMGTVTSSTGDLEGITINTNITFEDSSEAVEIPTHDPDPDPTPDPPKPGTPILITEPEGNSFLSDGVDINNGIYPDKAIEILMSVDEGIQNMYVKVDSDNDIFKGMVGEMGLTTDKGLDLTSDAAKELGTLFTLPTPGDTSYSFTLSETLLGLLKEFEGEHRFMITVIDQSNQQASATLIVRVTKNS